MGRPPNKSPIQNLSFAGAWSFPGGGFTGTIIGGYLCGTSVHKSLEKVPCALPEPVSDSRYVQLVQKNQVATNTIELVFEKPVGFDYRAGQYAVVELENPKYDELDMPMRSLSLVSHPDEDVVRFAMRLSHSSYKKSVDAMQIGERCRLFGPMGDLFSAGSRGIVFLVSGIGITPVLPILRDLEKQSFSKQVVLFYSNRYESGAAYHEDLEAVDLADYSYVKVVTSKMPRINADLLKSKLASLDEFDYYLVGTSDFLRSMQELLDENGVDKSHVVMDNFG
jgi:ferredoxin-NADP reductase